MKARFAGACKCGRASCAFAKGDEIHWSRQDGAWNVECWNEQEFSDTATDEQVALADSLGFR